jgi:hypothetical protein
MPQAVLHKHADNHGVRIIVFLSEDVYDMKITRLQLAHEKRKKGSTANCEEPDTFGEQSGANTGCVRNVLH